MITKNVEIHHFYDKMHKNKFYVYNIYKDGIVFKISQIKTQNMFLSLIICCANGII